MSKKQVNQDSADLVLKNGNMLTMDPARPQAESLAVRDHKIMALGSDGEIEPCIASHTRVIDLHLGVKFTFDLWHFLTKVKRRLDLTTYPLYAAANLMRDEISL